jgi:hypothetical protein
MQGGGPLLKTDDLRPLKAGVGRGLAMSRLPLGDDLRPMMTGSPSRGPRSQ